MGQYHILANLTKKQFVYPHELGTGLKLWEQTGAYAYDDNKNIFHGSTMTYAAWMLLAASNGRGGGDYNEEQDKDAEHLIGSWAGDRIALIGDYAESIDLRRSGEAESRLVDPSHDPALLYDYMLNAAANNRDDEDAGDTDGWIDITPAIVLLIEATHEVHFQQTGGWGRWELGAKTAAAS